jgi:hypothetical protein
MRLKLRLRPDALHRRFTHTQRLGQFAATPVGAAIRRRLLRDRRIRAWIAGVTGNGGSTRMQLLLDLTVAETLGERQDQPRKRRRPQAGCATAPSLSVLPVRHWRQ